MFFSGTTRVIVENDLKLIRDLAVVDGIYYLSIEQYSEAPVRPYL